MHLGLWTVVLALVMDAWLRCGCQCEIAVNSNKKSCCIAELVRKALVWINVTFYQCNMQSEAVMLGLLLQRWKQTTFVFLLSAMWLQRYKTVLSIKQPLTTDFLFAGGRKSRVNAYRSLWPFYGEGKTRSSFHYCLTSKPWQHKLIFNSVEAFVPGNHADCLLKTVVNSILQ